MFNRIIFLFIFLGFCLNNFGQQLRFRHITSENGLSTNYVSTIFQDDKGFIWFGTQDGLNKYDGHQIKVFKNDPTSLNSLSSSEINCVLQVKNDLILIGTSGGLNLFNPVTEKFDRLSSIKEVNTVINAVCAIDDNTILIGTEKNLVILNLKSNSVKVISPTINEGIKIKSFCKVNNDVFVGTDGDGLWIYNQKGLNKIVLIKPEFLKIELKELDIITDIKDYAGSLYVGTNGNGIFKLSLSDFEVMSKIVFSEEKNNERNFISNFQIRNSKLFVSTGFGLVIHNLINGKSISYVKSGSDGEYGLSENQLNHVFIDVNENLWVATKIKGVSVCFSQTLKFPSSADQDEEKIENVYSFLETQKGERFIGGFKSLYLIHPQSGLRKDYSSVLGNNTALCICQENENVFWIGTWGLGLIRFDKSNNSKKIFFDSKFGGTILCLKIHNGELYAGTIGDGLFKINLKTYEFKNFNEKEGLSVPNINSIFTDSKSNVWLGTYDGGLIKMKGFDEGGKLPIEKIFKNNGKQGQIASNNVLGVNEDKSGNIWVATANGLSKLLKDDSFHNFYEKDGLANSYLYSIIKDSLNNFWMSSNNGIIKFNPLQSEKEILFKNYGLKDGLVNAEYNTGAAYLSNTGFMYFGGAKGYNIFRPTSIKDNFQAPRAYVVSYQRGGNDVVTDSLITYKKHLNLSWKENYFQFELVALDYTDPSKNKFRYKLEGYDNDWSAPTSVRYVSYTELPGGEYTFKVKAANNDGIWNETPYEIKITVVPPFWKTKLFYFLVFLFASAGIYGYTQYRTKAIKKENKILENKVAERTKELAEKNRDITSSIEYAKRIQEAILPSKEQMFKKLKSAFILYQPKDIVSGDFYWFAEKDNCKILAVVDCTGHGVPGAFMSMIGHNLLHQIVSEKGIVDPAEILNNLHKGVQEALRQGQNEINTNDGMDVSLIAVNDVAKEIKWAGANRPLIVIDNLGSIVKYDGNKFPVGGVQINISRTFTTHIIKPELPSMAYMFTDGYADQFGGDKGKKYMVKRLYDVLTSIHLKNPEEQKRELAANFEQWKKNHEQVDDVLLAGIAI